MYTREAFERQRATGKRRERHAGRLLAIVSVGLGVVQLIFIRWIEKKLAHGPAVALEGALFLAYAALIGWLLWQMRRTLHAARLECPQCGALLQGMSERVAAATGRCDSCGGQVVEGSPGGGGPIPR